MKEIHSQSTYKGSHWKCGHLVRFFNSMGFLPECGLCGQHHCNPALDLSCCSIQAIKICMPHPADNGTSFSVAVHLLFKYLFLSKLILFLSFQISKHAFLNMRFLAYFYHVLPAFNGQLFIHVEFLIKMLQGLLVQGLPTVNICWMNWYTRNRWIQKRHWTFLVFISITFFIKRLK